MRIKKLWIPTVIIGAMGGGAKLCDTLFNYTGKGFFLDSSTCSIIFILSIITVLVIGGGMLIADRKTEIDGIPAKNVPAAFFGFIASVSIVGSGVISVFSIASAEYSLVYLIGFVLGMLGGVVMLYESCICFTGQNGMKRIPYLALALPAWSCSRLISLFVEYSKVSLHSTEMFDIISVTLLTLFMYYQSMFFAEINPKKCVGKTVMYGYGFVLCTLITTTDIILKMVVPVKDTGNVDVFVVTPTLSRILTCTTDIALCGFAIFFIIGMMKNLNIETDEEDDDSEIIDEDEFFGHIITGDDKPKGNEEIAEPVKFSGTTLTLEDTLSEDESEAKDAKESVNTDRISDTVDEEPAAYVYEEEIQQERQTEPQNESEVYTDNTEAVAIEPAFEINADVSEEYDSVDSTEQTSRETVLVNEPEAPTGTVSKENTDSIEQYEEQIEVEEEAIPEKEEENKYPGTEEDIFGSDDEENVFADENGDIDYDEVFRLLDEISGDNNF